MEHSGIIRNQSLYTAGGKAPLPTPQYANVSSVVGAVNGSTMPIQTYLYIHSNPAT